jgi:cell wall-associated NlpC family hydrolase
MRIESYFTILVILGVAFKMYSCTPLRPLAPHSAMKKNVELPSEVTGVSSWDDVLLPWIGTPYLPGGSTKNGADCSGFVSSVYMEKERMYIPRSTTEEYKMGKEINRNDLIVGDLVFFGDGRKVNHVGIYVGKGNFIHASTSNGVMISPLEDNYWKPKYIGAKRYL